MVKNGNYTGNLQNMQNKSMALNETSVVSKSKGLDDRMPQRPDITHTSVENPRVDGYHIGCHLQIPNHHELDVFFPELHPQKLGFSPSCYIFYSQFGFCTIVAQRVRWSSFCKLHKKRNLIWGGSSCTAWQGQRPIIRGLIHARLKTCSEFWLRTQG